MRIIIVGGGEVGYGLSQALAARHEVVVIDHSPPAGDRFEKLDVEFIAGGGTTAEVLRRAGIERAQVFIACTGLDEVNIVACGMANQLGSPQTICFVSREDFLSLPEGQNSLELFGIDRVVWPEAQLAEDIERIVVAPGAVDAETFENGAVRLLEYRLEHGSPLTEQPLTALNLPNGSLLVAVRRGDTFFIPRGDTRLLAGDKVVVMGTPEAMAAMQRRIMPSADNRGQTVTIVGGGDVGLRLAERLDSLGNIHYLRIIERDQRRGEVLAARLRHALVLTGDGTDLSLLEGEDIGRSDVLVSVIDNDEKNLLASLVGRQLGVRRIITRVSKPANLRLFERVGVDVALSARGAAVASVLHHIEGGQASLLAVLEEGEGRILEVQVPADYDARTLRDLNTPRDSIVAAILRDKEVIVPRGTDVLRTGDRLLVFSTREAAPHVRTFFSSSR
jgi:trk system potassium uptake protein TrkA